MSRIMIFTGKGGVGKTSVAAAHARKAAQTGMKTLLVSTDMAHNLGDLFGQVLGKEKVTICENLDLLEVDPHYEMTENYANIMDAILEMVHVDQKSKNSQYNPVPMMFPGIEELFSLLKIQDIHHTGEYDLIAVDCAPTGETLSLLKMPELLSWFIEKMLPIERVALKLMRPISKPLFNIQLPDSSIIDDVEQIYERLCALQDLLKDRETASIRLVAIPEKMVVEETKRNYMYLNLYDFNVDGLYINRLLPEQIDNDFFDQWLSIQKHYVEELETVMDVPIYKIRWYERDLNGIPALDRVIHDSLQDEDLFQIRIKRDREVFEKVSDGYCLKIAVPFASKEEMDVFVSGTDLIVRMGNWKRSIPLPNTVHSMNIGAAMESPYLCVSFKKEDGKHE